VKPSVELLPVLVEDATWPRFAAAIETLAGRYDAPSGRRYALDLAGERLVVSLVLESYAEPSGAEIDADLFELACALQDIVGEPWSGQALRDMVALWERASQPTDTPPG
jgi:hypothetical protein